MAEQSLYTSGSTVKSLWQKYHIYTDRVAFETIVGLMVIPFDQIETVKLAQSDVKGLIQGDLQLKGFRPALKIDWANFLEHVVIDKRKGIRRVLFTPEDPEKFSAVLNQALEHYRESSEMTS